MLINSILMSTRNNAFICIVHVSASLSCTCGQTNRDTTLNRAVIPHAVGKRGSTSGGVDPVYYLLSPHKIIQLNLYFVLVIVYLAHIYREGGLVPRFTPARESEIAAKVEPYRFLFTFAPDAGSSNK